ncbi:Uncharacterized phage protein gp47/JayE [Tistlia consotensis]|uniref:Uncharacterized phage protein gp47/JayE n=1 Tax=Tistlia consotensis USBA 355 TaxID=560819 RepID=A0A1Y6CS14_9PROT|nr:baseplate J/gp47 family protein [Tistlia consotensis]SMF77481.1 Uncharacterized phage protein gp47/JayE [Tistlia consotensis USBA 355]SMF83827.1 Uncharacterized phage protein gp47/JayE [Tistlia consotensis USBA 355]SNS34607.1 Uncharacterized phage protein gp47/JayE [Tistlia consotensis]
MPFLRPTPQEIRDRLAAEIEAALPGADARTRRSVEGVLARMMAIVSHELHGYQEWISRQILPDSADAEELERHAAIWGIARAGAVSAQGRVTLTGLAGVTVPAGTELRRADDQRYLTTADVQIGAGGTAPATVEAVTAGAAAVAAIGTTLALTATLAGVQSQAAVVDDGAGNGIAGGVDQESDAGLRARILDRIQLPPHGGNRHDYAAWVKEVVGETQVWVYSSYLGTGTVGVTFVMPDGSLPPPSVVEQVQSHIDEKRPVTADVTVFAPIADLVDFTILLDPDTTAGRAAVEAELADLLVREAEPGGTLPRSRVRAAISAAVGEYSHELQVPAGDIVSAAGHIARLGAITWA